MTLPAHVHAVARTGDGDAAPADPQRVIAGSGASRVWNAFSDAAGRFHVGHWSGSVGVRAVRYDETEFCVLLTGRVRLSGPDGTAEFGPGDAFVIAGGFEGTWECVEPVTKLYAILEP